MIMYLLLLIIFGLIVGALARLAIPGPNPMSIGTTILVGIAGSFIGGVLGRVLFHRQSAGLLLSVLCAAAIVYVMQRRRPARI